MLPKLPFSNWERTTRCFACSPNNPIGLKLKITRDGDAVKTEFTPGELHEGWAGIVHGGILFTLLDEVMSYVAIFDGVGAITVKTELRFRQSAQIGELLLASAVPVRKTRRLIETRGIVTRKDGTVVAEATATMYVVKKNLRLSVSGTAESDS
ncbi:MAG: PaaI family thioesterase [Chloroflexota bacterium]